MGKITVVYSLLIGILLADNVFAFSEEMEIASGYLQREENFFDEGMNKEIMGQNCQTEEECRAKYKESGRMMPYPKEGMFNPERQWMHQGMDNVIENPERYMQYCDNPEEMVVLLLEEMKNKGMFALICQHMKDKAEFFKEGEHECERIKEHAQKFQDEQLHQQQRCEMMLQNLPQETELDEKMKTYREEMKQRCEEEAEQSFTEQKEMRERMVEHAYQECQARKKQENEMREEQIKSCDTGMTPEAMAEKMKQKMMDQGKIMCELYKEQGSSLFKAMQHIDEEKRIEMLQGFEKIEKIESVHNSDTEKNIMQKMLKFFGFFKEDLPQKLAQMRESLQEIDKIIQNMQAVMPTLTDEIAKEALQKEIGNLQAMKTNLEEKIKALEGQATELNAESSISTINGFFLKISDFLKN